MQAVTGSLINMERVKPGSCEAFIVKLLEQLARFKPCFNKQAAYIFLCFFPG